MNVSYVIRFRGIAPTAKRKLDKMVRDDILPYPSRMSMDSATVEEITKPKAAEPARTVKTPEETSEVTRAQVRNVVKAVAKKKDKANAESRQR